MGLISCQRNVETAPIRGGRWKKRPPRALCRGFLNVEDEASGSEDFHEQSALTSALLAMGILPVGSAREAPSQSHERAAEGAAAELDGLERHSVFLLFLWRRSPASWGAPVAVSNSKE